MPEVLLPFQIARRPGHAELLPLLARRKLQLRDPRTPIKRTVVLQVLRRVKEGAIVNWINRHAAVVTPSIETGQLGACSDLNGHFSLQSSQWIGGNAPGITNRWVYLFTGDAVTDGNIAGLVHRDAAHPAEIRIGRVSALLENRPGSARSAQFVPSYACSPRGSDRVVDDQ